MSEADVGARVTGWVRRGFRYLLILALLPVLAGAGLALWAASAGGGSGAGSQQVVARVIGRIPSQMHDEGGSETVYTPVFEFTDAAGIRREARGDIASNLFNLPDGTERVVEFDPRHPETVRTMGLWSRYHLALSVGGPGLVFLLILLGIRAATLRLLSAGLRAGSPQPR